MSETTADARRVYLDVCLLPAAHVKPRASWVRPSQRRRVVFLHGWLQDHHSWLRTAQLVRRSYGHDCLLLDWPCHGLSETPVHAVMGPELCLAALRATLERVGWADGSVPLTLAGCSYGGAMAMRYTSRWPDEVDRLVRDYSVEVTERYQYIRDQMFEDLRRHLTEEQIVELTLRIALCGFFNRFNDI